MSTTAALRATTHQSTTGAGAYVATVARTVASLGDPLHVILARDADAGDLEHEVRGWPRKASLPVRGDQVLVIVDDAGDLWAVAWAVNGWARP